MITEAIHILDQLQEQTVSDDIISGNFLIDNQNDLYIIKHVLLSFTDDGLCKDENGQNLVIQNCNVDQTYFFELNRPKLASHGFFITVNDFVKRHSQEVPTHDFYIKELKYCSWNQGSDKIFGNYKAITQIVSALRISADYELNQGYFRLVFLDDEKYEIDTKYEEVIDVDLNKSRKLLAGLKSAHDKHERRKLFRMAMNEVLHIKDAPILRFGELLQKFSKVYSYYTDSHTLYLNQFSFQKLKNEFEESYLDYAEKLSAILSNIDSKILSIPLAYVLILGRFEFDDRSSSVNNALCFSALIYCFLLQLLFSNQKYLLTEVTNKLKSFEQDTVTRLRQISTDDFTTQLENLKGKKANTEKRLTIITILLWLIPTIVLFLILSIDCKITAWATGLWDYLRLVF